MSSSWFVGAPEFLGVELGGGIPFSPDWFAGVPVVGDPKSD